MVSSYFHGNDADFGHHLLLGSAILRACSRNALQNDGWDHLYISRCCFKSHLCNYITIHRHQAHYAQDIGDRCSLDANSPASIYNTATGSYRTCTCPVVDDTKACPSLGWINGTRRESH